jgi:hypothetical protein
MIVVNNFKIGDCITHSSHYSDLCVDGKPCDNLGDILFYTSSGVYKESQFKDYRKYSSEFRIHSIKEFFKSEDIAINSESCSCSKCGQSEKDKFEYLMYRL